MNSNMNTNMNPDGRAEFGTHTHLPVVQHPPQIPDERSYAAGWIAFSLGLAVFLVAGMGTIAMFGIPGSTGGTSPNQQQASGAPQPTNESTFGNAGTRETTGYGAPEGARPPREQPQGTPPARDQQPGPQQSEPPQKVAPETARQPPN